MRKSSVVAFVDLVNTEEAAQRLNVGPVDRKKPDGRKRKRDGERRLWRIAQQRNRGCRQYQNNKCQKGIVVVEAKTVIAQDKSERLQWRRQRAKTSCSRPPKLRRRGMAIDWSVGRMDGTALRVRRGLGTPPPRRTRKARPILRTVHRPCRQMTTRRRTLSDGAPRTGSREFTVTGQRNERKTPADVRRCSETIQAVSQRHTNATMPAMANGWSRNAIWCGISGQR